MPKYAKRNPNHRHVNWRCKDCPAQYTAPITALPSNPDGSLDVTCPVNRLHALGPVTFAKAPAKSATLFNASNLDRPRRSTAGKVSDSPFAKASFETMVLDQAAFGVGSVNLNEVVENRDYAPPKLFNPSMRYTTGGPRTCRNIGACAVRVLKTTGIVAVAPAAGRSDTAKAMGNQSATFYVTKKPNKNTLFLAAYEWCHLQADCLGGPTVATNLVAASNAANTEMLVIENVLQGHTEFSICVDAFGTPALPDFADFIEYKVYRAGRHVTPLFTWLIDGTNVNCTKADADSLSRALKGAVGLAS